MPRPRYKRNIRHKPISSLYKPAGQPAGSLEWVSLPLEGLEALRLVDAEGFSQSQAAEMMGVSTPTLCRVLGEARSLVARALADGQAIRIEGGDYRLIDEEMPPGPGPGPGRGRRRRRMGGGPGRGGKGGRGSNHE